MADRSVKVRLLAEVAGYVAGMKTAASATKDFAGSATQGAKDAADGLSEVKTQATVLGSGLLGLAAAAVVTSASFDKQMSAVKAATGAAGSAMDDLRKAALDAGASTVFSASEAADAQTNLAKAGVSTADILGGALKGSLSLAAAGSLDVADAAEIAATAMTQFELKGTDVEHIADLLASGANKAQGSVSDLGLALKYVGPVAHQMGISIEETTGTIAELASNGILADQAGTSLRGMLTSLTSPSKLAAKTMKAYGIEVYDTAGNFVGFNGVAGQLQTQLGKLDNQTRDVALGQIFGNEQITAARVLYAGGAKAVDEWTSAVNDSGAAARAAATLTDNLAGDFEQLKGAIEVSLINGGTTANESLRSLTQGLTTTVTAVGALPSPLLAAGLGVAAIGGGFLLLAPRIMESAAAFGKFKSAVGGWGGIGKALGAGLAVGAIVAVGTSSLAARASVESLTKETDGLREALGKPLPSGTLFSALQAQVDETRESAQSAMNELGGGFKGVLNSTVLAIGSLMKGAAASDGLDALAETIKRNAAASSTYAAVLGDLRYKLNLVGPAAADMVDQAVASGVVLTGSYHHQAEQVIAWSRTTIAGQTAVQQSMATTATAATNMADVIGGAFGLLDRRSKIRAFKASIDDASAALKENGKTLDANTPKGRANADALDSIAQKSFELGVAKDKEGKILSVNAKVIARGRAAYLDMAEGMGMSESAAKRLADKVFGTRKEIQKLDEAHANPQITVNTKPAYDGLKSFERYVAGLTFHVGVSVTPKQGPFAVKEATGGYISGPGSGTSDSIPAMLSNGEYVINAKQTSRNLPLLHAINSGARGFAAGGYTKLTKAEQARIEKAERQQYLQDVAFLKNNNAEARVVAHADPRAWATMGATARADAIRSARQEAKQDAADKAKDAADKLDQKLQAEKAALQERINKSVEDEAERQEKIAQFAKDEADGTNDNNRASAAQAAITRQRDLDTAGGASTAEQAAAAARAGFGWADLSVSQRAEAVRANREAAADAAKAAEDERIAEQNRQDAIIKAQEEADRQSAKDVLKQVNAARQQRIDAAQQVLDQANDNRNSTIAGVASSLRGGAALMGAVDLNAQAKATDDLAAAKQKQADAESALWDARRKSNSAGTPQEQADAARDQAAAERELAAARGDVAAAEKAVGDAKPTGANILAKFRDRATKLSKFRWNLSVLAKRGLSPVILQQIQEAGIDEGGDMAAALVADGDIAGLNSVQNTIDWEGRNVGEMVADWTGNSWAVQQAQAALTAANATSAGQYVPEITNNLEVAMTINGYNMLQALIAQQTANGIPVNARIAG